jgi:hypothetical protein
MKPDDIHGGDESELTPEQQAESRKNNSREAFERMAKASAFPISPHASEILSAINKKPIQPK